MLELFKLAGRIDLEGAAKAEKELDSLDKKGEGLRSKIGKTAKKVGKAGLVIGGAMAAVGTASFAMVTKVTSAFDDISKGSQRLGVSSDSYQEMAYWASQNGISHQQMEKTVGRFNQRMGMAQNGNEKYSAALKELGVDMDAVRNGTLSTDDAFSQSIKTLSEMENQQDQVNLATEMFGVKTARDLLPALQDGSLSLEDAKKKAQELGIVIGEDSLNGAVKFQDTWDSLKRTMTAVGQQMFAQLMPAFQSMMDWVMEHMPQIQATFKAVFDAIGIVFNWFKATITEVVGFLKGWFSNNEETMNGIWLTIQTVFTQVIEFLREAWATIKAFWEENGEAILANAKTIFESVWSTIQTVFQSIKTIIEQVLEHVVPFIQEKLEMIMKFWDENGEQIMAAIDNAFTFIKGVIEFVMPIIQGIIKGAWKVIQSVFDTVIGVIMGLVKTFASLLTGDFEGVKEGLTKIWESLWNGIKGIVEGAWTMISGAFSGLWESVEGWFSGIADDAIDWGKDLIRGFWDGIKGMGSWIARKVSDFVSENVPSPIKKILGIASPSKLMMEYGEDTGEGLALGIEDKKNRLQKAAEQMGNFVQPPDMKMGVGNRTTQTSNTDSGLVVLLREQNELLMKILNKNQDIYLSDEKITQSVNTNNAVSDSLSYF